MMYPGVDPPLIQPPGPVEFGIFVDGGGDCDSVCDLALSKKRHLYTTINSSATLLVNIVRQVSVLRFILGKDNASC